MCFQNANAISRTQILKLSEGHAPPSWLIPLALEHPIFAKMHKKFQPPPPLLNRFHSPVSPLTPPKKYKPTRINEPLNKTNFVQIKWHMK